MAEFESCEKCKYNSKAETEYPCNRCVHNATDKFEPITNADKIRAMSDEELAEFLNTIFIKGQIEAINKRYTDNVFNRKDDSLKWLQSEAEMEE